MSIVAESCGFNITNAVGVSGVVIDGRDLSGQALTPPPRQDVANFWKFTQLPNLGTCEASDVRFQIRIGVSSHSVEVSGKNHRWWHGSLVPRSYVAELMRRSDDYVWGIEDALEAMHGAIVSAIEERHVEPQYNGFACKRNELPHQLQTINERVYDFDDSACTNGFIYFLLYAGEIVYVGQTINLKDRIADHRKECRGRKLFDRVLFIQAPRGELNALERKYIKRFSPMYNKKIVTPPSPQSPPETTP